MTTWKIPKRSEAQQAKDEAEKRTIEQFMARPVLSFPALSVVDPEFLCEAILTSDPQHPVKYLQWKFDDAEAQGRAYRGEEKPQANVMTSDGLRFFAPFMSAFIKSQTCILADGVEEYAEPGDSDDDATFRLFERIVAYLSRLYYYSPERESAKHLDAALVMFTYLYDKFKTIPYGRSEGSYGTAKSRRMKLFRLLAYRSIKIDGASTPAAMFQAVDRHKGTVVADESDFTDSAMRAAMIKIYNLGNQAGNIIARAQTHEGGTQSYDPFCPKFFASRESAPDQAFLSRSFTFFTERIPAEVLKEHNIPLELSNEDEIEAAHLRRQLLLWRFRSFKQTSLDPHERVEGVEPRVQQIAQPLISAFKHERIKQLIRVHVQEHGKAVYHARLMDEKEGDLAILVAKAIMSIWAKTRGSGNVKGVQGRITIESVRQFLIASNPFYQDIPSRTVGKVARKMLKLTVKKVSGTSVILPTAPAISRLREMYGTVPDISE